MLLLTKIFLLFSGAEYYPQGGIEDFIGDFDTLEESISGLLKEYGVSSPDEIGEGMWAHIYDSETREIVWRDKSVIGIG